MKKDDILAFLAKHDIKVEAVFVPWSRSRSFAAGTPVHEKNLNWTVKLLYKGRAVIETDYSAGIGHCPAYKNRIHKRVPGLSLFDESLVEKEVEGGFQMRDLGSVPWADRKKPLMPDSWDVIYSLLSDGDAVNQSSFEDWASDLGFDTFSRKAEAMYRACLDIGLKLRAALGDEVLNEMREIFQDY